MLNSPAPIVAIAEQHANSLETIPTDRDSTSRHFWTLKQARAFTDFSMALCGQTRRLEGCFLWRINESFMFALRRLAWNEITVKFSFDLDLMWKSGSGPGIWVPY